MKGDIIMTQSKSAKKNKQQKHSKKFFEQYLYNAHEPQNHAPKGTSTELEAELEAELLEDIFIMRKRFKHNAQRLRSRFL